MKGGVRVVAIGGGRGLATTLRAARRYATEITAIVSVADDGGSSGQLSEAYGLVAPGDIRKCLVALAAEEGIVGDVFEYRFANGPLEGHSVGNVLLVAFEALLGGILPAVEACGAILGCSGKVLPVSSERLHLEAELEDGTTLRGQALINRSASKIRSVKITPSDAKPSPGVLEAILAADQILLGPGSLYTSVIPPLLVDRVRGAISESSAKKIYICNLIAQQPETFGLTVAQHYKALVEHGVSCDVVLYHPWAQDAPEGALDKGDLESLSARAIPCYLAESSDPSRHDPLALATALASIDT